MDTIQNYKCPCCGAPLVFDAGSQGLHCESCENKFDLDTIRQLDDAERRRKFSFQQDRDHFYYKNITDKGYGNQDCLDFDFSEGGMLISPAVFVSKEKKRILVDAVFEGGEIRGKATVNTVRDGVDTRGRFTKSVDFKLNGNGVRRTHEIDMSEIDSAYLGVSLEFASDGHAKIYSFEFAD